MGNIRTKDIKKASRALIEIYPEKFGKDFEENKKFVQQLKLIDSKIERNKVAGYITRIKNPRKHRG